MIVKKIGYSTSTEENILKRFEKYGEADLRALQQHCMRPHHATIIPTVTRGQVYLREPFSPKTVHHCIQKCNLKLSNYSRRKTYINRAEFSGHKLISDGQKDTADTCMEHHEEVNQTKTTMMTSQ